MRELWPGLPAGRVALDHHRAQALGGAVDGGGQPGGPAAHHHQVVEGRSARVVDPHPLGDGAQARAPPAPRRRGTPAPAGGSGSAPGGRRCSSAAPRAALDVEPAVRHVVARQEVLQLVRLARPAVAHHADAVLAARIGLPVGQEVVEHRVELLLGRVPGLHQVVVERHPVDGVDRRLGVGVGGQQDPLGVGHDLERPLQELDAGHPRHALVGHQQGDRLVAQVHLGEQLEALGPRLGAQHAEALAVAPAQVALDRPRDARVVVDAEDHGLLVAHGTLTPAASRRCTGGPVRGQ